MPGGHRDCEQTERMFYSLRRKRKGFPRGWVCVGGRATMGRERGRGRRCLAAWSGRAARRGAATCPDHARTAEGKALAAGDAEGEGDGEDTW